MKYDLEEFECRLFGAVDALHLLGSSGPWSSPSSGIHPSVRFGVVRGPAGTGWKCTKEGETWTANMKILLDPGKGKLRVKKWEYEAVGSLVDGLISVTFFDGEGDDARQVSLDEALPREVLQHFAIPEDEKMDEGLVFDMSALSGETGLSFRMKNSWSESGVVEVGGDAGDDAAVAPEQRPPIRLSLAAEVV